MVSKFSTNLFPFWEFFLKNNCEKFFTLIKMGFQAPASLLQNLKLTDTSFSLLQLQASPCQFVIPNPFLTRVPQPCLTLTSYLVPNNTVSYESLQIIF